MISPVTAVTTIEEQLAAGDSTVTSSNAPTVPQNHSETNGTGDASGEELTVMNRTGNAPSFARSLGG